MVELLAVAFLGGLVTGLSPCIVPVLPVILAGGSSSTSRSRPYLIIAGLVVSFSLTVLFGITVLSALGLPLDFLKWFGISALLLLAIGLMIPAIGELIEKPFARFAEPGEHRARVIVLLLEELHDDGILHVFEVAVRIGNGSPVLRFRDRALGRYRGRRWKTRWDRAGYGKGENAAAKSEHRPIILE